MLDDAPRRDGVAMSARTGTPLAIVIGAGPRIGRAVAERFGQEGFRLALIARRGERLRRVATALGRAGVPAVSAEADAGDPKALRSALEELIGEHGDPQVLVYNAAADPAGRPSTLDLGTLGDALSVHVGGLLTSTQTVLPAMREHGRGTIIATGAGVALDPRPEETATAVGKAAARALLLALAKEVEFDGVHVALVTVMGSVAHGTAFNPASIAEAFWTLHTEPSGAWRTEVLFSGRP
jgi:short-subunit dehydrogenase